MQVSGMSLSRVHLQNAGAAEHHSTEKKGKIFPAAEIPLAGEGDWLAL